MEKSGRYVVAGVTSWGYDCGAQGYPGVYARVTSQLDWIKKSIGDEATPCDPENQNKECL